MVDSSRHLKTPIYDELGLPIDSPWATPQPLLRQNYTLSLDFETRSACDLRKHGLDRYARHHSTRVLMLAWAIDSEAPQLWFPAKGPMPQRLRDALLDPVCIKCAWNGQFERVIFWHVLGVVIPYDQWRCTMVNAFMLSLPGRLELCGKVLGLDAEHQKMKEGSALIRLFCMPQKPNKGASEKTIASYADRFEQDDEGNFWATERTHPEDWKVFCDYCIRDVVSERRIKKILSKYPVAANSWTVYALDQKVNDAGMPLDMRFIHNALAMVDRERAELVAQLKKLTGLKNPNSPAQLLKWAVAHGYPFGSTTAAVTGEGVAPIDGVDELSDDVRDALEEGELTKGSLTKDRVQRAIDDFGKVMHPDCVQALEMRLQIAKTSVKKFTTMLNLVGPDGMLRYAFQMAGAGRTNRWAGRGVQLHNLPRPAKMHSKEMAWIRELVLAQDYDTIRAFFGSVIDAVSSSVRSAIAAPPGYKFVVSDLSSIETRISAEIANCESLRQIFAKKLCPYRDFASAMFKKPYDQITGDERQLAKPCVLGGFFMLSGGVEVGKYPDTTKTGLLGYAAAMGVKMSPAESKEHIRVFRDKYHEVPVSWAEIEAAAIQCVTEQAPTQAGILSFDFMAPFLRMRVPSGAHIYYLRPKVGMQTIKHPGGTFKKIGISYESFLKNKSWGRVTTHAGKFFENGCQRIAYDVLAQDLIWIDEEGFDIRGHVHDEGVTLVDEFDDVHSVHLLEQIMSRPMPWMPSMSLAAEGYESVFYRKG